MTKFLLSIDQGTTGSTALLLDRSMKVLGSGTQEFTQYFPKQGWVEHDPDEIYDSVIGAISEALKVAGVSGAACLAIGVTNQRETSIAWSSKDARALHRAIVWQDRRTATRCEELVRDGYEPTVKESTGLLLDAYFSATKYEWLIRNSAAVQAAALSQELRFGTVDSYLVYRLSGDQMHVSDASNASRTMLYNISEGAWDVGLCEKFSVPLKSLPRVCGNSEIVARTKNVPGLPDGIPIAGMAGDQQAALFGQACFQPGDAKCTYGTGAFLLVNTGKKPVASTQRLLTSVAWKIGGQTVYCLEGSAFVAGAAVQWLRDGLGLIERSADVEELARKVPDSDGVVFVPALTGLGAPHWQPHARGLITGITRGTTSSHIARATLEGIAYQVYDLVEAIRPDMPVPLSRLRVDGGAAKNDLLMQFQSDLLDLEIDRPEVVETTALGAAYLAGLAVGVFEDLGDIEKAHCVESVFTSKCSAKERVTKIQQWENAVKRA